MEKEDYAVAHMFFFAFKPKIKKGPAAVIKNSRPTFFSDQTKMYIYGKKIYLIKRNGA